MGTEIKVEVNIQDVWNEMNHTDRMDFLRWNLSDEGFICNIIKECFDKSDIRNFINENLDYADENELVEELSKRGFVF